MQEFSEEALLDRSVEATSILIFTSSDSQFPRIQVHNLSIEEKEVKSVGPPIPVYKPGYEKHLSAFPNIIGEAVCELQPACILFNLNEINHLDSEEGFDWKKNLFPEQIADEHYNSILGLLCSGYKKLANNAFLADNFYFASGNKKIGKTSILKASFYSKPVELIIKANAETEGIVLEALVKIEERLIPLNAFSNAGFPLLLRGNRFYVLKDPLNCEVLNKFRESGFLQFKWKELSKVRQLFFDKYQGKIELDIAPELTAQFQEVEQFEKRVYFSELNDSFLLVKPAFVYNNVEVEADREPEIETVIDAQVVKFKRLKDQENDLMDKIFQSHIGFKDQKNKHFVYLKFSDVLKKNWFLNFHTLMQENEVQVFGLNKLKKLKLNHNTPVLQIETESKIDWFELKIKVLYGNMEITLKDLSKAIINKQQFILLEDNTLGVIPEEWIEKYSHLLQLGQAEGNTLKISKLNFPLIEGLSDTINNSDFRKEISNLRDRFDNFKTEEIQLPETLQATLRPYQMEGYRWMSLLNELNCGGCLADDMGLGKTLQTITFLLSLLEKNPGSQHLIVCPSSLMYNWERELSKFAPSISYQIHHGGGRRANLEAYQGKQIIITSYGTLRSDVELFRQVFFGYVVLDESHAIKNPSSKITKALLTLQSKNRLAISGTPLQNNTFDLYSQMHFVNPGMLGNKEFFRNEFANPIDLHRNTQKTEKLRKIIYPFMLRRTKQEVAKDLPEKTETILYCEMAEEQRKIYDAFRNEYRNQILENIEREGLGKSGIKVLEGLMKLRQICDSPAILNEDEVYPNHSVKLDELLRELNESVSNHKVLVFSQFLGMLSLISQGLTEKNIRHQYFDGSTPPEERQKMVEEFQENDDCRVFLISLKAGGVGLTLTAADYVYLVDPWWNPAIEQQAIDRTHRIGQKKNIFAYRMICKDTIEEKILQLQEKKKSLSDDLITEDSGFVKKLTKEDIEFLFE